MTEQETPTPARDTGSYEVVVLVEHAVDAADATRLQSLHEGVEEPVRYHVMLPVQDAATGVEAAMGQVSTGEVLTSPAMVVPPEVTEEVQEELLRECREQVAASVAALGATGAQATGAPVAGPPLEAVAEKVAEVDAREVIVLTRPHVVQEFFHLDWTSRAQRRLDVPVLHLVEHASEH